MSKNIIMQQKTASGYEELYPKADGDSSVIVNNTTNQFLGGGSTVGDALEYLSKFGMYWWKKVYQKPNWAINETSDGLSSSGSYYGVPRYISANFPPTSGNTNYTYPIPCATDLVMSENGVLSLKNTIAGLRFEWAYVYNDEGMDYYSSSISIVNDLPFYFKHNNIFYKGSKVESFSTCHTSEVTYGKTYVLNWRVRYLVQCIPYISSYTTTTTYICSSDPNAYPDQGNTDSSGAKYWKVGQPWEFLPKLGKVETGYYSGTGSGNVTLTFENAPQFLCVGAKNGGRDARMDWWIKDSDRAFESPRDSYIPVTISGNSLLLSSSYLNRNGVAYQYFAITQ